MKSLGDGWNIVKTLNAPSSEAGRAMVEKLTRLKVLGRGVDAGALADSVNEFSAAGLGDAIEGVVQNWINAAGSIRPRAPMPAVAGIARPDELRASEILGGIEATDVSLIALDLHKLREILELALHVDEGIPRISEDAKQSINADIEARRLHEGVVERIDDDLAFGRMFLEPGAERLVYQRFGRGFPRHGRTGDGA